MTLASYLAYTFAVFIAAATPGPAMLAVLSTGIGRGMRHAGATALGIASADVALLTLVLVGLAIVARSFGWAFEVIRYAGAFYLALLGWRMWRGAREVALNPAGAGPSGLLRAFLTGAAIAFGNPKAILFHASLMPLLLKLDALGAGDFAAIFTTVFALNIVVMGGYAGLAGASAHWLRRSASAMVLMQRLAGSVMIGSGIAIATRR
jgi:threonine/homoserine/homoserine lactone efflux protein